MIDREIFVQNNPDEEIVFTKKYGEDVIEVNEKGLPEVNEEGYMICTHRSPGFCLANKRWCFFDVDHVSDIEFNSGTFDALLLPAFQKTLVRSLIGVMVRASKNSMT